MERAYVPQWGHCGRGCEREENSVINKKCVGELYHQPLVAEETVGFVEASIFFV